MNVVRVEPVGVAHGSYVEPGGHERLLDGIRRWVVAPEDQPRRSMQPVKGAGGERREGVVIALRATDYEASMHRTPGSGQPYGLPHPP